MESRINHSSYVIGFLDVEFDSKEISRILKTEVDEILCKINGLALNEWEILFKAIYTRKMESILVFKNSRSYVNEKYKEIVIHIPIPSKDEIHWGVDEKQYIRSGNTSKFADEIEIDQLNYSNRRDYILECMRKSIAFCFKSGFTINKIKIKYPPS